MYIRIVIISTYSEDTESRGPGYGGTDYISRCDDDVVLLDWAW
jgi:hypothetical protein